MSGSYSTCALRQLDGLQLAAKPLELFRRQEARESDSPAAVAVVFGSADLFMWDASHGASFHRLVGYRISFVVLQMWLAAERSRRYGFGRIVSH